MNKLFSTAQVTFLATMGLVGTSTYCTASHVTCTEYTVVTLHYVPTGPFVVSSLVYVYIPFVDIAIELISKTVWSDVGLCN